MKKTLRVSVLVMLLACSAYAGDMPNGVTSTPRQSPAVAGDMPNGVASTSPAESTATDLLLTLLQSFLALF